MTIFRCTINVQVCIIGQNVEGIGLLYNLKIKIRTYSKKYSVVFETEILAEIHSDINISRLYCIKSSTGTTIIKVCLSFTKHTAKF